MSATTTPDLVTLRLPRDVAREHLRALEELLTHAEEMDVFAPKEYRAETPTIVRDARPLRETLHAALYCPVVP